MFSSLAQALGVDSSFFVQFAVFLVFYPVLARALFRPYVRLADKRERETALRIKKAEELKAQTQALEEEYKTKARKLNENFNKLYERESKKLRVELLKQSAQLQEKMQKEHEQKKATVLQEIKTAEKQIQLETDDLIQSAVGKLLEH